MFGDMMGKLQEMKQKNEEVQTRLEGIIVKGEAGGGRVVVTANGQRTIKNVSISADLMQGDPEELEDLMVLAMNKALQSAKNVEETEMRSVASDMLPGGLGGFPGFGK